MEELDGFFVVGDARVFYDDVDRAWRYDVPEDAQWRAVVVESALV